MSLHIVTQRMGHRDAMATAPIYANVINQQAESAYLTFARVVKLCKVLAKNVLQMPRNRKVDELWELTCGKFVSSCMEGFGRSSITCQNPING